ncbi:RTL1: Retrotransposon-like 1 [Crotalus adamanteus]|uniref:RTL1: Retrotransposon-like 1 n=1 Tax=Crotalus adamanteus TaxID=8729 RepID=A0AAW1BZN9_CROAD
MVHHFRTGLDIDLHRACVVRGIVGRLSEWFKAAVELDVGLRELPGACEVRLQPRKGQDQSKDSTNQMPSSNARPKPVFRCFRCNRPGHRAAECTFPKSTNIPTGVGRPGTTPKKMTEKSRVAHQVGQTAPGDISPALEEYEEEGPMEDPMVNDPIVPFHFKVVPGGKNFLADALSRLPQYDSKKEEVIQAIMPSGSVEVIRADACEKTTAFEDEVKSALLNDSWSLANPGLLTYRDGAGEMMNAEDSTQLLELSWCEEKAAQPPERYPVNIIGLE